MEWTSVTVVAVGLIVFWASALFLMVALAGTGPQASDTQDPTDE